MTPTNYRDDILPQDSAEDDSSLETATSQPLSEAEIEDLLYGEGRSTEERLRLLRALRDDIADREGYDVGDDDPEALIGEIEARITELESEGEGDITLDSDPLAHRETLSPDSDELEELEEEDDDSLEADDDAAADYDDAVEEDFEDEGDIDNDDDVAR